MGARSLSSWRIRAERLVNKDDVDMHLCLQRGDAEGAYGGQASS